MTPRIGHRSGAVELLKTILNVEQEALEYWVEDYECSLLEIIKALLDAIERGIV